MKLKENVVYTQLPEVIRLGNEPMDSMMHPSFHFGKDASKREPFPGDIITDGTDNYLVLDPPKMCSSVEYPWIVFKVPPIGLFKVVGTHGDYKVKEFNKYDEMRNRVLKSLPHLLENLDMGHDITRRMLLKRLKEIMFQ